MRLATSAWQTGAHTISNRATPFKKEDFCGIFIVLFIAFFFTALTVVPGNLPGGIAILNFTGARVVYIPSAGLIGGIIIGSR